MMKNTLLITLTGLVILSCSGNKTQESQTEEQPETAAADETQASTEVAYLEDYMKLKDALVQSDAETAKNAALSLSTHEGLADAASKISTTDDLEAQRAAFKELTDKIINNLKSNDTREAVFVQYCPMAFDNTGANWLSLSKEIRNPYFGDKMLKCGRVEEEL